MNPLRSGLGEDVLAPDPRNAGDGPLTAEGSVGTDGVGRDSADGAAGVGDGRPLDHEVVTVETPGADLNGTGDDPLDVVRRVAGPTDHHRARVLDTGRVGSVDDVGARDALAVDDRVPREAAGRHSARAESEDDHGWDREAMRDAEHLVDGSDDWRLPGWTKGLILGLVVVFVAAMLFAVLQPVRVLPRIRLAPGFALVDADGQTITSEDGRGAITLYTFVPAGCGARCDGVHTTMDEVASLADDIDLAGAEFRTVTLVMGADHTEAASDRDAAVPSGSTWVAVDGDALNNVVGLGFARPTDPSAFSPAFAIVDGWGMIRGEYRYSTLADDGEKLLRHIDILGSELRNDRGFASFVYEAAHAFQCYP